MARSFVSSGIEIGRRHADSGTTRCQGTLAMVRSSRSASTQWWLPGLGLASIAILAAYGYLSSAQNAALQRKLLDQQAAERAIIARARSAAEHGDVSTLGPMLDTSGILLQRRIDLVECAARSGQPEAVRILLDHGWPSDGLGHSGRPLVQAACAGRNQVVKLLVAHGASANVLAGGVTPLMGAIGWGDVGTVKLLLSSGADVNARVPRTPIAAFSARPPGLFVDGRSSGITESFPSSMHDREGEGLSPRLANMHLATALMRAARGGRGDIVQLLLAHGADPTMKSDDGLTAADVARAWGHEGVDRILLRAQASRH